MNLYLIRGLPGSGKSTLAKALAGDEGIVYAEADHFFYDAEGNYNFNPDKLHRAHQMCFATAEAGCAIGVARVVVSNTFTTEKELKPYLELAEKYGYRVTSIVVENRHGNVSVHDVPDLAMDRMRNRFSIKI